MVSKFIYTINYFYRKVWCHALASYRQRRVQTLIKECWLLIRSSVLQKPRKVSAGVLLSGTLSVHFLAFFPHYGTWYQASFSIEVISHFDTNSFQFKSFQYKFIQLRCSFMYLAYLKERKIITQNVFLIHAQTILVMRYPDFLCNFTPWVRIEMTCIETTLDWNDQLAVVHEEYSTAPAPIWWVCPIPFCKPWQTELPTL